MHGEGTTEQDSYRLTLNSVKGTREQDSYGLTFNSVYHRDQTFVLSRAPRHAILMLCLIE